MSIKKPNFVIIGAPKCGTTTLAAILAKHPDCCMSKPKEVSFFQDTVDFETNPNYQKGWGWYSRAFSHCKGEKMIGEATPSYSDRSRSPNTAERIYQFNPGMKIIYMVRNPLERQISGWQMQQYHYHLNRDKKRRELDWANKGFDHWMRKQKLVKQWDICLYMYQIEVYKKYFNHIHITFLEDWRDDQRGEIQSICHFLGLEFEKFKDVEDESHNTAAEKTVLSKEIKNLQKLPFAQHIKGLIPRQWKQLFMQNIGFKKFNYMEHDHCKEIKSAFLDYVRKDAEDFLVQNNKSKDFWGYSI